MKGKFAVISIGTEDIEGRSPNKKIFNTKDEAIFYIINKLTDEDNEFVDGGKVDSFGKVQEVIINPTEINCHRCHWHWKVKDGGYDLFICHNCNYDNSKYYMFKGEQGKRILEGISYKNGGSLDKDYTSYKNKYNSIFNYGNSASIIMYIC
jgi:hypothetical protein